MIELGISTFGETTEIEGTGITPTHDERIRELVEEIKLADFDAIIPEITGSGYILGFSNYVYDPDDALTYGFLLG